MILCHVLLVVLVVMVLGAIEAMQVQEVVLVVLYLLVLEVLLYLLVLLVVLVLEILLPLSTPLFFAFLLDLSLNLLPNVQTDPYYTHNTHNYDSNQNGGLKGCITLIRRLSRIRIVVDPFFIDFFFFFRGHRMTCVATPTVIFPLDSCSASLASFIRFLAVVL